MEFSLLETMLLYKDSVFLLRHHLCRLYNSAKSLNFHRSHLESFMQDLDSQALHANRHLDILESLAILANSSLPHTDMKAHILNLEASWDLSSSAKNAVSQSNDNMKSPAYRTKHDKASKSIDSNHYVLNPVAHHFVENLDSIKQSRSYPHLWDSINILESLLKIDIHTSLHANTFLICRMLLSRDGSITHSIHTLESIRNTKVKLATLKHITPLSHHKTTSRLHFAKATQSIAKNECFDYIYIHEDGRLIEGSRSNILIVKNGRYYTPKRNVGLLTGTLCSVLIDCGICDEEILYIEDLYHANAIYCINSIRGIIPVSLD